MTIIILDPSLTVRTKIEDLIEEMNFDSLDIHQFNNAENALEFSKENNVELIFSSIETEQMNGITFVDHILRETPKLVSKLFIVTSQKHTESLEDMKDIGAKRFIPKPINEEYFNHFVKPEINKVLNR
ncbi:response regulator [Sulfurimonas sp.]|nr:response regulator [Sulfurimonas sp.]